MCLLLTMDWKFMYNRFVTLLSKELRMHLYSLTGVIFMLLFLIVSGCLLWVVPGAYNIIDAGYSTMSPFFAIAPILLLFLIPALSMRSIAEEKKMQTILLLRSRPVSFNVVVLSKMAAIFIVSLLTLLPSVIYVLFIYYNGSPMGNLDVGAVVASYIGLLFLIIAFISLSVFASSLTSNQVVALILGMLLCAFFFYGFELLSLENFGILYYYNSIQRGLIEVSGLLYFSFIAILFYVLTIKVLGEKIGLKRFVVIIVSLCLVVGLTYNISVDLTKDNRYSLDKVTKEVYNNTDSPIEIEVYLSGSLNSGFKRLQESVLFLLSNLDKRTSASVVYSVVDPYKRGKDFIENLNKEGVAGVAVNEKLSNGRISQNIIYPYALLKYKEESIIIPLLVNQSGYSGEENLNSSIEMLEYKFTYSVDLLSRNETKKIAILDGHSELSNNAISEALNLLSYEYEISRVVINDNPESLNDYDLVIMAGSRTAFSEEHKFVLDQYLMQGGKLLCFINGVKLYAYQDLIEKGETTSMMNDLNINDILFNYGIRINPVILKDANCLNIPLPTETESGEIEYVSRAWYYSPLLVPNNNSEITKGLSFVKTSFASTISLVGDSNNNKTVLLSSSSKANEVSVPAIVSLQEADFDINATNFNKANLPVAVLLEAPFTSAFTNRTQYYKDNYEFKERSDSGKMIVVASEEVIMNPLGYDRYSQTQFANQDFILNVVDYLTDSKGLSSLKNKSLGMQLLDKKKLSQNRNNIIFYNVVLPPLLILILSAVMMFRRKRK
ncbi:ABC-2 type transport system permease protein [Dysgonomonadaceae bacterium PH5-43]|nr:ABC-2 type transport system permease protein [Dysgonomonadaceae bacterium PH5-43]